MQWKCTNGLQQLRPFTGSGKASHLAYIRCALPNSFVLLKCVDRPLFLRVALLATDSHLPTRGLLVVHLEHATEWELQ